MRLSCFASGSSGNCALLELGGGRILLDAGISCRRIKDNLARSGLAPEALDAVLITHEHTDHIAGLATLMKQCGVSVYAPPATARALRRSLNCEDGRILEARPGEHFSVAGIDVLPFATPHDSAQSVGWRITGPEGVFALATDMGRVTEEILAGLLGADTVIIEANHDEDMLRFGPNPVYLKRRILSEHGHLSNADCALLARALAEHGTRRIVLGHLSRENNTPSVALRTVRAALEGLEVELYAAPAEDRFILETEGAPCSV